MKMKHLNLLFLGFVLCLASASNLPAQMTGMSWEVDTCFYAGLDSTDQFDPNNELPGFTSYLLFADFTNPADQLQAVYALGQGQNTTSPWLLNAPCGCFEHDFGTSIGVGWNPIFLDAFPNLLYDSHYTLDNNPGTSITGGIPPISGAADLPAICNTTLPDAAMYVLGGVYAGGDLKVQIARVTTCGPLEFQACFQVQQANGELQNWCATQDGQSPLFIDPPCLTWAQMNTILEVNPMSDPVSVEVPWSSSWPVEVELFDALTNAWSGTFEANAIFNPPPGEYYAALKDNSTCRDTTEAFCVPLPFYDCDGVCLDDSDGDGICDPQEIPGCMDELACNYVADATDWVACIYPDPGYDCNGDCLADGDGDGICDPFEIPGCTSEFACNFNALATDDDGSCVFLPTSGIQGPTEVVNALSYTYSYPLGESSSAAWIVTGGDLLQGQGTGSIDVMWLAPGNGLIEITEVTDTCSSGPVILEIQIGLNGLHESTAPSDLLILTEMGFQATAPGDAFVWDARGQLLHRQALQKGSFLNLANLPCSILLIRFQTKDQRIEQFRWMQQRN